MKSILPIRSPNCDTPLQMRSKLFPLPRYQNSPGANQISECSNSVSTATWSLPMMTGRNRSLVDYAFRHNSCCHVLPSSTPLPYSCSSPLHPSSHSAIPPILPHQSDSPFLAVDLSIAKPGAYPPTCVCRPRNWLLGSRARTCGGGTRGEVVKIMSSGRTIDGFRTTIVVEFPLGWKSQSARKGNGSVTENGQSWSKEWTVANSSQKCSHVYRSICHVLSDSV